MNIGRVVVFAVLGALLTVHLAGPAMYVVDELRVLAGVEVFDLGYTEIHLPPFGAMAARTHFTPVKLTLTLDRVELTLLEDLAADREQAVERLTAGFKAAVRRFVFRQLAFAAAGGAASALLAGTRTPTTAVIGAGTGFMSVLALGLGTFLSYDPSPLANPRYEGILGAAPWMVDMSQQLLERAGDLSVQLGLLGKNLSQLFGQVDRLAALGQPEGDVTILVVADIHNNALVVEFVGRVAQTFQVDMIIDAGDLTDFGSGVEARLVAGLADFSLPYILVPGNHESPEALEVLGELPQVIILDREIITIQGVRILGYADPGAMGPSPAVDALQVTHARQEFEEMITAAGTVPDIAVAHNPQIVDAGVGMVPILIAGHTHRLSVVEIDNSILVNPGTTGGAGIRGLTARQEVPFSVVVLYLKKEDDGRITPVAADTIQVFNLKTQFTIERILFGPEVDRAGSGS